MNCILEDATVPMVRWAPPGLQGQVASAGDGERDRHPGGMVRLVLVRPFPPSVPSLSLVLVNAIDACQQVCRVLHHVPLGHIIVGALVHPGRQLGVGRSRRLARS